MLISYNFNAADCFYIIIEIMLLIKKLRMLEFFYQTLKFAKFIIFWNNFESKKTTICNFNE